MHQFDTFIINSRKLLDSLKTYEADVDSEYVTLDCETNSEIEKKAVLWGIGLCFTDQKAFYIPYRDDKGVEIWSKAEQDEIKDWILEVCQRKKLIGHNILYDILVIENNLGITLDDYIYSDTILCKHTLDEEPPFALKEVAVSILGPWADQAQDDLKDEVLARGGSWKKDSKEMYLASTATLGKYCCWDVMLTFLLFKHFDVKLKSEGLTKLFYEEEVMPLYKTVTINMKRKGFPIDIEYYKGLKHDIETEIGTIEQDILKSIAGDVLQFEKNLLDKEYPVKSTGIFPVALAKVINVPLPINKKTGKTTLATKAIEVQKQLTKQFAPFYDWLLGTAQLSPNHVHDCYVAQRTLFFERNPDERSIFNLNSNDHLGHLIFNAWGYPVVDKTPGGKPKLDDEYLEGIKNNIVISKLVDYKKLNKLLSTYVDGILERQIDGYIYTSMLQFGTTSGRYSSRNPNLQNQPRIKSEESNLSPLVLKYVNAIRKGFVAGKGRKIVNADYSALEPRCFAHMSGDQKLRDVFLKGEDLYSRIGIDVFKVENVSPKKKDPNYLGTIHPEIRDKTKIFTLAVPYGAEESRISQEMGVSYQEAAGIIKAYLNAYPGLRKYMFKCNYDVKNLGMTKTEFGRIRHLSEAKSIHVLYGDSILDYKYAKSRNLLDIRRKYKNCLNNSKNFPIQGLAAHIVNRAMIELAKQFKAHKIDGWIGLQVHDEVTCVVSDEHADLAAKLLRDAMENTTKISIPLIAEPKVALNWAEAK